MHANERNEIKEVRAGDIAAAVGLKDVTTGDTLCATEQRDHARADDVPGAGHRDGGRAEDQVGPGKDGHRPVASRAGRSVVPRALGRGIRPDDHRRHGRAASGDHRRSHEARVQRRGERRQAAGRVSRNDPQGRAPGRQVRAPVRRQGQYGHVVLEIEPQERGKGYEFENEIGRRHGSEGIRPGGRQGHSRSDDARRPLAGYPGRRRQDHARRRFVPRSRLERNGVQDRRLDGASRKASTRPARCCSSRS